MTWSPAERSDRIVAALWAAAALGAIASTRFLATIAAWLPPCPFRLVTGFPCLSCGGTHSVLALSRGDLWAAVAYNPLIAGGTIAFVAGGLVAPLWIALGGNAPSLTSLSPRVRLSVFAAIAASWVVVALGPA